MQDGTYHEIAENIKVATNTKVANPRYVPSSFRERSVSE
jgi:hypothetical protein